MSEDMLVQYLASSIHAVAIPQKNQNRPKNKPTFKKHPLVVRRPSETVCLKAVETVDSQKLPGAS